MVCGDPEIVCHCLFLLCGKFFDGFVGVRQPNFVDVVQNVFARFMIILSVALQDLVRLQRIFERHKRNIWAFLCANKEDERFFADKTLVVVQPSHAMMKHFALMDEIRRTSCDHANKGVFIIVFERQIFFRYMGEIFIQLLLSLAVRFRPSRDICRL